MINNFTSIFELAAALNLAYASIPQLAKAIHDVFFKKITDLIDSIEKKAEPSCKMIEAIDHDDFTKEKEKALKERVNKEINQTTKIKNNINEDSKNINIRISNIMQNYFVLVSIMSICFMYIGGITNKDELFPTELIVYIYLAAIFFIICRILYSFNGDRAQNILLGLGALSTIVIFYMWSDYLIGKIICLNLQDATIVNIMLGTMLVPLLITLSLYAKSSHKLSKKYSDKLKKQSDDIDEILDNIEHQAKNKESMDFIDNLLSEKEK